MAHTCKNCGCNKIDCGCKDTYLTTPPPCPTPEDCPDAQPCSEVFDAECIIYNGTPLTCAETTIVSTGESVASALDSIIDYFCSTTGTDTIVAAGANVLVTSSTVGNTTTYTVNGKEAIVAAGNNITVTSITSGQDTTYTVNGKETIVTAGAGISVFGIIDPVTGDTTYNISATGGCPMTVAIASSTLAPRSIGATVTGGTAPYTYTWEMADLITGTVQSMITLMPTAFPNVVQPTGNPAIVNRFDSNGIVNGGFIGLAKVIVTDANGCIAKDTFLIMFPSVPA